MKVLVFGGRNYQHRGVVRRSLIQSGALVVIHGGCLTGADQLADEVAREMGLAVYAYKAQWRLHGRAAGPIRNQRMLDEGQPDLVLAFPGGRGTADMVRRARKRGVRVVEIPDSRQAAPEYDEAERVQQSRVCEGAGGRSEP